jgi:hypothetical protein
MVSHTSLPSKEEKSLLYSQAKHPTFAGAKKGVEKKDVDAYVAYTTPCTQIITT